MLVPSSRQKTVLVAGAVAIALVAAAVLFYSSSLPGQPGTKPAAAQETAKSYGETWNPTIRVNLTPLPINEVPFGVDGPYRVVVPGSARVLAYGDGIARTVASIDDGGIRIGESVFPISELELVPVRSPSVWVGRHQYRGTVRLLRKPGDKLIAVNHVPLEEYIASVIDSEVPSTFGEAARQAQAIVARTYAVSQMKGHPLFDVFATSRSQRYLGFQYTSSDNRKLAGESASSRKIAVETAGVVCTYQGKTFTAYYSAVCGGRTINGRTVFKDAVPALKSVECNWCREADRYRWTSTVPIDEASNLIRDHLKTSGKTFGIVRSIRLAAGPSGDLPYYEVSDEKASYRIAGTVMRRVLPFGVLNSPDFEATLDATTIRITGRGHGHGVGFCQWGAAGQAKAGRSALEIIRFYYPGAGTVRLRPPK
jgi:stage II sporulation protein D